MPAITLKLGTYHNTVVQFSAEQLEHVITDEQGRFHVYDFTRRPLETTNAYFAFYGDEPGLTQWRISRT